jgi:glycosyltransferase involved in cell wall biosynthesis
MKSKTANKTTSFFVDCHVFDGNLQGTTSYIKGLYSELIKDKSKTFFLAAFDIQNLQSVFGTYENLVYLKYKSKNKFIRLLFDIPKLIKTNAIDYAHFQYIVTPIKKCKYIVTLHDVLFLDFPEYFPFFYKIKNKFLFKASANYSDVVLTVSEYSKKQIQEHFNISKIAITPNAVDPIYFETYNKKTAKETIKSKFKVTDYFLYVSRWEPRKNRYTLLKSFVENQYYKEYNLVFVGDKAIKDVIYETYYDSLDCEIKESIYTFTEVNFQDLLLLVRGASLSIYPSIAEGFGIPPLESLAAGVPTICSNTTAMSDFYFLENCLFDPLSIADINKKIQIGLNDNIVLQKRAIVQAKYNWKFAAKQFEMAISTI